MSARHLVTVWDPSRGVDPLQAHLELLLDLRRRERMGELRDDDVYVWWGKIRSPNRQQPLPHLAEVLALDELLAAGDDVDGAGVEGGGVDGAGVEGDSDAPEPELHLYLTDYRSLYVAHVGRITAGDVRETPAERERVPSFYDGFSCDLWFHLWDVRRIVLDDTLEVITELRKLRNVHYHGRPVSIYGGMVNLPLVVTRDDGARWFDPDVRDELIEGRSWAEFDAELSGLGSVERALRDDLVGDAAWQGLDPAARTFVATAEKVWRDHRNDAAFDFSPVLVNLAKAFEVQVNGLLRRALRDAPLAARQANVDGRTVDVVTDARHFGLAELARIIGGERTVNEALGRALVDGRWFTGSLPPLLEELARVRNPAAHSARLSRDQVKRLRDRLVGVGCVGELVQLGRARTVR